MATPKAREGSNKLKEERKNSAPSSLQSTSSNERRSPRPITPDNHKQQQTLNNVKLKSTVAPIIAPKFTSSKRLPMEKPTEKSPTLTPKSRTTLPSAPIIIKEGSPVRLPYAAPRQFASLKPSWDQKVSKSASSSGAKTGQAVARARLIDSRREADKTKKILDSRREAPAPTPEPEPEPEPEPAATSTVDTSIAVNNEALATLEEKEHIIIDSLGMQQIHNTSKLDKEQDPVDSTPIEAPQLMEYPQFQLNSNAEETSNDYYSMQMEEKKAEDTNDSTQMEEDKVEEISTDSSIVEEGSKIEATKSTTRRGHRLPAVEPPTEEAKPTKIRAAMDASKRNTEAVKKETVRSNDVIEEAKSKLLETRKNKVLALVGAFETVMALQESEGQQPKAKEEGESSSVE